MSHDRLVVCPECDDLIVEDEWDLHKRECVREGLLCQMSDASLSDYVDRKVRHDPRWYEKHDYIRRLAEEAVARLGKGVYTPAMFPGPMQPVQKVNMGYINSNSTVPATAKFDFARNAVMHTLTVQFPTMIPLKREEAMALALDQLYEQWEAFDFDV